MRRLLIGLYNRLGTMLIKMELNRLKKQPFKFPAGPFYDAQPNSLSYMTSTIYDEEEDVELNVKYICSCDEYVYEMGVDGSFACTHCDSVCTIKGCEVCQYLHSRDLWEDDASI